MIKTLFGVLVGVFALNFLAAAGGVGYLVATHQLDRAKVHAIRDLIVSRPGVPTTQPTTQPATQPSPEDAPKLRLAALLDKVARRPAGEQVDVTRAALDAQSAAVERRLRELDDQRASVAQAQADLEKARATLKSQQDQLQTQKDDQAKQAADQGFQNSLALYQSLPAKRVKAIFQQLDDDVVVRYLQAMDTRQAAGVLKEFKTPDETTRARTLFEKMRQAQAKAE